MAGRLSRACEQLGLDADAGAMAKLLDYLSQLQRWNRTYNLTAIRDPQEMLVQHLFDSLAAVRPFSEALGAPGTAAKIYDVGSGGGLPGVVLAIMRPDWSVTCVDAVEKKTAFVRADERRTGFAQPAGAATHASKRWSPRQCNIVDVARLCILGRFCATRRSPCTQRWYPRRHDGQGPRGRNSGAACARGMASRSYSAAPRAGTASGTLPDLAAP